MTNVAVRVGWACLFLLAAGCSSLLPEDAAPAKGVTVDPELLAHFPGAQQVVGGLGQTGESALRDQDRLLLGIEVVLGQDVTRHLLEVIVRRHKLGEDVVRVKFTTTDPNPPVSVASRYSRLVDLEFVLRKPDGVEVERSRVSGVPEFVLDESFVPPIGKPVTEQPKQHLLATLRLLEVTRMLGEDPILQSLLRQAATVPMDVSLLWRRVLHMTPYFEQGRAAEGGGGTHELPFDLFLNDSLLVRLVASVRDPYGPTGAFGGIVALRAQDARDPDRYMRVQVLGAERGPHTDWQRHGVHAVYGYADQGTGMALSPASRWVAMPGGGNDVILHDVAASEPCAAAAISCAAQPTSLACLDDATLLVASKHALQVVDVADLAAPRLLATHAVPGFELCEVEVADDRTVFVGGNGYAMERWRFDVDRTVAPRRELVQGVQSESVPAVSIDGIAKAVSITRHPGRGWLLARGADCVVARGHDAVVEWRRSPDKVWQERALKDVDAASSSWRLRVDPRRAALSDRLAKGEGMIRSSAADVHAWGAGPHSLTGAQGTRFLCPRGSFTDYCHGFTADGRYYAFVAPGYRVLVDVERFLAGAKK